MGAILPRVQEKVAPGREFFNIGIFRMNISKYSKVMVESYVLDNLKKKKKCRIFAFLTIFFKVITFRKVSEKRL